VSAVLIDWSSLKILELCHIFRDFICHRSKNSFSLTTPRNNHLQSKIASFRAIYRGHIVKGVS